MLAQMCIRDRGPKAGRLGGEVVFAGTPQEMLNTDTMTSQYLNGKMLSLIHIFGISQINIHRVALDPEISTVQVDIIADIQTVYQTT